MTDPYQTSIRNFGPSRPSDKPPSKCCKHSYCTNYTNDPSGFCAGHRTDAKNTDKAERAEGGRA